MSMSITQALPELKLLDKRIENIIDNIYNWTKVNHNNVQIDVEKHKKDTEAEYQSFQDLIKRRDTIKRAIILSNAQTKVNIGSWEGTVAEAIEYKRSICNKRRLIHAMKNTLSDTRAEYDRIQTNVDSRLERLLQSELGKDMKTNPETIQALTTTFRNNNKVELLDPLGLADKIKSLESEFDSFETNVDWVLSQSNATTFIQI